MINIMAAVAAAFTAGNHAAIFSVLINPNAIVDNPHRT
jgi:hypothetical protein